MVFERNRRWQRYADASAALIIGGMFNVTTHYRTTPDAFSFTDHTGATLDTVVTSNAFTVAGLAVPVAIFRQR